MDGDEAETGYIPPPAPKSTLTITLPKPVTTKGGETIVELRLREPRNSEVATAEGMLGDGKAVNSAGIRATRDYQSKLLEMVSGLKVEDQADLPARAYMTATRYLDSWIRYNDGPAEDGDAEMASRDGLLINLVDPIGNNGEIDQLRLTELTLSQLKKAESFLGDYSPAKIRAYKRALVSHASGYPTVIVDRLPVSVMNRAAAYVQSFMQAAPATGD